MKNSIVTLLFILGSFTFIEAQVASVKYLLEYNESTALYDVKIYIEEGSATTIPQRIQFNAQISVIVPTGSTISISDFFNPIENNQDYTGTVPMEWILGNSVISPPGQPESDFHGFYPSLITTSSYNNLFPGDTVTLFNLDINVEPCENSVRFFENGVDPGPTQFPNNENFTNGITIGSIAQLYTGNLDSYYGVGWDITLEDYEVCESDCIELIPSLNCSTDDLTYAWSTGETTPTITVCPNVETTYTVVITAPNGDILNLESTVSVIANPIAILDGPSTICIGGITFVLPSSGGTWVSDASLIATVTNAGVVTGVSTGITQVYHTDSSTGCTSEGIPIEVILAPEIMLTGPDTICVMGTTTLEPSSGGTWTSSDPSVATIDNFGNVTGVGSGCVTFTFTSSSTGCFSEASDVVCVFPNPEISITGEDVLCVGETTSLFPGNGFGGGTWESNNTQVALIDSNTGIVTSISAGEATFTYTVGIECSGTSDPITVHPLPVASTDENEICVGASTTLSPTTGTWTISDTTIANFSDVGVLEGLNEGTVNLVFTDEDTGCSSLELTLSVLTTTNAVFTGPDTICAGEMTTISPTSGGFWTLSYTNSTIGTSASIDNEGNILGLNEGQAVFTYLSSVGCGTAISDTLQVFDLPEVAFIEGDRLCIGACSFVSSTTGGIWISNNSSVATIDPLTGKITAIGQGTTTFSFTDTISGCSVSTTGLIVDPNPTTSTESDSICIGSIEMLSPSTGGTWEALHPEIAALDANNVIGLSHGDASFLFTAEATGCISDTVLIHVYPEIETSLTGPTIICPGETTTIEPSSGGTWSSTNIEVAAIDNFGTITGVGAGQSSFIFTSASTLCESEPSELITVLDHPIDFTNTQVDACLGTTLSVFPNPTGGTWTSSNQEVATIDSNLGFITTIASGMTEIKFTQDSSGCSSSFQLEVFDNPSVAFVGDSIICIGATSQVEPSSGGVWEALDGTIATITNSGSITGISSGTASFVYTDINTGCSSDPIDVVILPESDPLCIVGTDDLVDQSLKLYPNPARDRVNVESIHPIQSLAIYTLNLQKIKQHVFQNSRSNQYIATAELHTGLYLIAIETSGNTYYKKLFIE